MKDVYKKILIIIGIGLLVYFVHIFNGFVWDDEEQIINNVLVHSVWNWPKFFAGGAFNSGGTGSLLGAFYKPMMTLSFSLVYSIFGASPIPFHLLSLVLHISNAIFVFLIFKKFFKIELSLILASIFLVHPLYSEVVFYAANMQDVLFFFFGVTALWLTIEEKLKIKNKYVWIFALLAASLLSKETGIIFVGLTVLYKFLYNTKSIKIQTLASAGAVGLYSLLRFVIAKINVTGFDFLPFATQGLSTRLISLPKFAVYYLQNLIYPVNLVPNQRWFVTTPTLTDFGLPLAVLIFFLTTIIVPVFRKDKIYIFFLILFLTSFAIHLQIIPLDVSLSGRWFYLPMFGLLGIIGTTINNSQLTIHNFYNKLMICGWVLIVILSVITFFRGFDWKDGLTLYSHDAAIVKNDFNLENNLGVELFRIKKYDEAGNHFQNSVDLAPDWWTNWNNLGAFKEYKGDLKSAGIYYKKAIDNGNYYLAYENYAAILLKQGKLKESKDFLENTALRHFPQNQRLKDIYQYLLETSN